MPRMRILTPDEQAAFETPPVFTPIERHHFLQIPESLETLLTTRRSLVNQVGFVVMLGYFRASKRFFARQFHQADIDYVTGQLGYLPGLITLETYDKSVQSRHRQLILDYLGFRAFDDHAQDEIIRSCTCILRIIETDLSRDTNVA
jgi:Domain of unknown function (DUF4158)